MNVHKSLTAVAVSIALVGCSESTGLDAEDLQGSWTAAVYEYTDNANASNVEDIIQTNGASFTMTVDASGTASTLLDDGLGSTSSDSGTLNSTDTVITLGGATFNAARSGDVLTLTDADQSFDFGSGSTSATLRVVMNRD